MADIKTKNKSVIKKLDKATVKTQKVKKNIVRLKNRTNEINNKEEQSVNDYIYNRAKSGETTIKNQSVNIFNKTGKKSFQETRTNVAKLKNQIDNYKIKTKNNKTDNHIIGVDKNKVDNQIIKIKADKITNYKIKTRNNKTIYNEFNIKSDRIKTPKYIKEKGTTYTRKIKSASNITAQNIKNKSKKIINNSAKKSTKAIKTIVRDIKAFTKGTKAMILLITAGGFLTIITVLVICILGAIMAIFNSGGDSGTAEMWSSDLVSVAKSQIGVTGGDPYWSWYGFEERVAWCAIFVSWCADQTGYIQSGEIPKYSACSDGINWFKAKEKWQDRSDDYIPKMSDIIFFDWEVDGLCDHTGIVESVDLNNMKVKTIEGNSNDAVKERTYSLSDKRIVGYGTPNIY